MFKYVKPLKYPFRMARPRQWKKKFSNIHTELKASHRNFVRRQRPKHAASYLAKASGRYRSGVHKMLGYGKYRLKSTNGIRKNGKRFKSTGGRKVWHKTSYGMHYRG